MSPPTGNAPPGRSSRPTFGRHVYNHDPPTAEAIEPPPPRAALLRNSEATGPIIAKPAVFARVWACGLLCRVAVGGVVPRCQRTRKHSKHQVGKAVAGGGTRVFAIGSQGASRRPRPGAALPAQFAPAAQGRVAGKESPWVRSCVEGPIGPLRSSASTALNARGPGVPGRPAAGSSSNRGVRLSRLPGAPSTGAPMWWQRTGLL